MIHSARAPRARRTLGSICVVVAVTLSAGCNSGEDKASTQGGALSDIDDYLPQADLNQLAEESDLVVRGRVVQSKSGVLIADDPSAKYSVFTVRVAEVVRGEHVNTVDIALLTEVAGAPVRPEGRPAVRTGNDAVWLLTRIAPEFNREGYVLTNQSSLLVVDDDGRVKAGSDSSTVGRDVAQLQTVDAVVKHLRSGSGR